MDEWNELLDAYAYEMEIASAGYEMMGRMLDRRAVVSWLKERDLDHIYIYGGGYLGVQLYQNVHEDIHILSVVDKSAGLLVNLPEIPVIGLEEFESQYKDQTVIVTPVKFYSQIQDYLSRFVRDDRVICLGELLGGII